MFVLKKVIAAFVLPAGCFVAMLAAGGIYFWRRHRPAGIFCFAMAGLLWLGSSRAFSEALLRPLENVYPVPEKPAGQVIVVLSGGFREGVQSLSACGRLPEPGLERVIAAAGLQKRTGLPVLATGGSPYTKASEASGMAACLTELGVPPARILLEEVSRDTHESAVETKKICAAKGYDSIVLLTSASHLPRAVPTFAKAGFANISPYPAARVTEEKASLDWWDLLPGTFTVAVKAVNEYVGLVFYKAAY